MSINSRIIAKNTIFLYARLILVMGVTLYAARVVLEVLGATDYGLYYAVFSVIGLLSFLNGTLSGGTSRFITFELGRGDFQKLKTTFGTALVSHLLLAGIILVLGETIGLWYATNKLVVPEDRMHEALIVYQISIISTILSIIQVPFTAEIIAHERMNIYAYLGIYESVARLIVVYLLLNTGLDKLVFYAWLQLAVAASVFLINIYYTSRTFREVSLSLNFNKKIFRSIVKFSGWNIIANISETLMSQGVIMLYNLFFLPVVVTAQAIANQIAHAISQLVGNVRQAVNPQIIKLYADDHHTESQSLTFLSAEYIFYLLLLLGVPIILVMPKLLSIWLVEVPEYAVSFSRLIIAQQILGSFSAAFYTPMLAANKLAKNSVASVFLCIFQFGVLWILFHFGFGPLWARYLGIISAMCFSFIVKPYILWKDIHYNLNEIFHCIRKCMITGIIIIILSMVIYNLIPQVNLFRSITVVIVTMVTIILVVWMGLDKTNKMKIIYILKTKIQAFIHNKIS